MSAHVLDRPDAPPAVAHRPGTGTARRNLVALLQLAHSGELGAALAYEGHAASLRDPAEQADVTAIMFDELDHRARVRAMLDRVGASENGGGR